MGHKYNTITPAEHKERSMKLINQGAPQSWAEILEVYFLYNDVMEPRKQPSNCGTCKAYVWNRLKQYYGNS